MDGAQCIRKPISFLTGLRRWNGLHTKNRFIPRRSKLIKLADVTDNTASCAYGLHDLGAAWVKEQYMPQMVEMRNVITADCFLRYTRIASILIQNLQFACERLESNLKKW